jgi:4-hydroxyphenylacetate decarboxylase small subunit
MAHKNYESIYYLALDCEKGMDARTHEIIMYDGEELGGDDFVPGYLCKFCKNYTNPDEYGIATCVGFEVEDWTYGDCGAAACEHFERA